LPARCTAQCAAFIAPYVLIGNQADSSNGYAYIRRREIIAFEQQGLVHRLGKSVSGAIAKIEPRPGIDAFAIAPEGFEGESCEMDIMGDNFGLDESEQVFEVVKPVDPALGDKNVAASW
jgi:hypothetical protein